MDVINKPKQGKVFSKFRVWLMNVKVYYDDEAERNNMNDRIAGVISDKDIELNTVNNILS